MSDSSSNDHGGGGTSDFASAEGRELRVLSRHALRTEAYDRALVIAALGIAHWILRERGEFLLCVEPRDAETAGRELEIWERDSRAEMRETSAALASARDGDFDDSFSPAHSREKKSFASLFIAGWLLAIFFFAQNSVGEWWLEAGAASSEKILRGEWWRAFTALTLHADFSHLGANIATGLIFAAFLLPIFGSGWTWLLVVLSGAFGNLLNAWGHRGEVHDSIGASTAVFGALGVLVGAQCAAKMLALRRVRAREIFVPVGAGLALLAYLGVGDEQTRTDFTAHFFGLFCGLPLGVLGVFLRLKKRTPFFFQTLLGLVTLLALVFAWLLAMNAPRAAW